MKKILLIVEKSKDGTFFGRLNYDDNLIVDDARSVEALKRKFPKLLKEFHDLKEGEFELEVAYDLTTLFEQKGYLNISAIADKAGINPSLMRQYAAGIKFPSEQKTQEIENVIHQLGQDLLNTKVRVRMNKPSQPVKRSKVAPVKKAKKSAARQRIPA